MTRERLHDLVDLVMAANYHFEQNDMDYLAAITISQVNTHIWIHDMSDKGQYWAYNTSSLHRDDEHNTYDPELIRAQEHIHKLMEGKANVA